MRRRALLSPFVFLGLALYASTAVPVARAADSAEDLLARVRELNRTTRQWADRTQELELRIVDRRGGERDRSLVLFLKKYPEDRNRSIVFFKAPPEVKNVSFMQWANPHGTDEQWLLLPALKRVRKISGSARRESFVGTDFNYDDLAIISQLTDWTETDVAATHAGRAELEGVACHRIDFRPAAKELSYGRIRVWFRVDDLVMLRFEMFDTEGEKEKELTMADVREIGAVPTPHGMTMKNLRTGSYTVATFTSVLYDTGLKDSLFSKRAMERGL